jgi:hypothetical protein
MVESSSRTTNTSSNSKEQLFLDVVARKWNSSSLFEYTLGYFTSNLSIRSAQFLARFMFNLPLANERVVLALSPFYEDDWHKIREFQWTNLIQESEERSLWRIKRRVFVVGYPHNESKCSEVFQYGWNSSLEDPLISVVTSSDEDGRVLADAATEGQLTPGHEYPLRSHYSTIINRYHDGLWTRILSTRVNPDQVQKLLQQASNATIGKLITRMPRSSWPKFQQPKKVSIR